MELGRIKLLKFLGLIFIGFVNYQYAEALQCYVCENCIDGTNLNEIQICGELPSDSTTQLPSSTLSTIISTTTIASSRPGTSTTTQSSSSRSSRRTRRSTAATTTRRTTTPQYDSEENDADYEYSDENDRRRRRYAMKNAKYSSNNFVMTALKQDDPVCYMVKYRVNENNTEITSLGCTSIVKNNVFLTCQSLNRSDATIENCQLCGKNGCNKLFFEETSDENDWEYSWFNGSKKNDLKTIIFLLMLVFLKLLC